MKLSDVQRTSLCPRGSQGNLKMRGKQEIDGLSWEKRSS